MRFRTSPILVLAFGILLLLMAFSGLAARNQTRRLYTSWESVNRSYLDSDHSLQQIRSDVQVSGLLVRDYLLDPSPAHAPAYKARLLANRAGMLSQLDGLEQTIAREHTPKLQLLRTQLQAYWDSLEPLFGWSPLQKQSQSSAFLQTSVIPRRDAALALANEIERINEANYRTRHQQIDANHVQFESVFSYFAALAIFVGLLVAVASVLRISRLEKGALRHQSELRHLSQQLVVTQEEERRGISRELHDQVGQMLTGLRMEVSHLQRFHSAPRAEFDRKLEECRTLLEQTVHSVRDLAMGLRPSMLDDLGLGPALEWQAREFARRYDIPVNVSLNASLTGLNETQKISIYRVVQEALTNCARHARASAIGISLHDDGTTLKLAVADDGVGLPPSPAKSPGLGLIGIQERVRDLGGVFSILSSPKQGTTLAVDIPLRRVTP